MYIYKQCIHGTSLTFMDQSPLCSYETRASISAEKIQIICSYQHRDSLRLNLINYNRKGVKVSIIPDVALYIIRKNLSVSKDRKFQVSLKSRKYGIINAEFNQEMWKEM